MLHLLDTIPEGEILSMAGGHKRLITTIATEEDPHATPVEDKTIMTIVDNLPVITDLTTKKICSQAPIREISHDLDLIAEVGKILDIGCRNNTTGHDGPVCTLTNEKK